MRTIAFSTSGADWTVYAVETAATQYRLAVYPGGDGQRRCVVLRGESSAAGSINVQDSDPQVGGRSLFDVPVAEWRGQILEVATIRTSPILQVAAVANAALARVSRASTDAETYLNEARAEPVEAERVPRRAQELPREHAVHRDDRGSFGSWRAPPAQPRQPEPDPYPLNHVKELERAAALLRRAYAVEELMADIAHHPDLHQRAQIALVDCQTRLTGLIQRTRR